MARFPAEGTQSGLGFAAQKNPHQGIAAIAPGFWKMFPVVIRDTGGPVTSQYLLSYLQKSDYVLLALTQA